ncbi:MAG: hypothetical protein LKK19_03475 [Bacteroidales bacterium]|jgi:ComF family protein|nr:hypothetical protein [Bacteroidales bacterium]MCI2121746.1 hypothetical protein [Bacteroidales bacterium]MCI2145100.1 hypothetical protein [Bacteroidales bacterium]
MDGKTDSIRYVFEALAALVFGHRCVVCGLDMEPGEKYVCRKCLEDMPLTRFWQWDGNPAEKRMEILAGVEHACSLFFYREGSPYRNLIKSIKYHGNTGLAGYLGLMLGSAMSYSGKYSDICAVIPVPLHRRRRRKRGYNQAELVACGIAEALSESRGVKVPVLPRALKRIRHTKTQTRLSGNEKAANVRGAFSLPRIIEFPPGSASPADGLFHVLLVDDVLTTGATLASCIGPLFTQRNIAVSVATLGYTE